MHIAASERTRVRPLRGRVGWVQREQVNFVLMEFSSQRGVNVSPCTHLAAEWGGKEIAPAARRPPNSPFVRIEKRGRGGGRVLGSGYLLLF